MNRCRDVKPVCTAEATPDPWTMSAGAPAPWYPTCRALYSGFLLQPCFLSTIRNRIFIILSSNRIQTWREELVSAVPAQQLPYFQPSKPMAHLLFDVAMMGLGDLDRIFFL